VRISMAWLIAENRSSKTFSDCPIAAFRGSPDSFTDCLGCSLLNWSNTHGGH